LERLAPELAEESEASSHREEDDDAPHSPGKKMRKASGAERS